MPASITHEQHAATPHSLSIAENQIILIHDGILPLLQNLHYYRLTSTQPHVSKKNHRDMENYNENMT
jgi:hypothetical protein